MLLGMAVGTDETRLIVVTLILEETQLLEHGLLTGSSG
jgi:hypothetical protein